MTSELITYYIPNNTKVQKGPIYTLYLNHNNNLDLSSILTQSLTINNLNQSNQENITIPKTEYEKVLQLNEQEHQLNTKRKTNIQNFIQTETEIVENLTKINMEKQQIIKKIKTKG